MCVFCSNTGYVCVYIEIYKIETTEPPIDRPHCNYQYLSLEEARVTWRDATQPGGNMQTPTQKGLDHIELW